MTLVVAASPPTILQFFGNDGTFLVGGQLFTTVGGIPYPTYADPLGLIQHANPIILNSRGEIATSSGQSAQLYLIPNVTYTFALFDAQSNPIDTPTNIQGIPTAANIQALITAQFIGAAIYVLTDAEKALSITPTSFAFPADPYVDPRRYGADPTGLADSTVALQTAINVAYQASGCVWLGSCSFLSGPLSLTMAGSATAPLRIMGSSVIGSAIIAKAGLASTALMTFKSTDPISVFDESFLVLENFSIVSTAIVTGVHGLSLQGLAKWRLSNLRVTQFDRGLDLQSCLTSVIDQNCEFVLNNTGIRVASLSAGTNCNLIRISDSNINLNHKIGIDFNGGSDLQCRGVDIEGNGTSGDLTTGGVVIRGQIGDLSGFASVLFDGCWFESNLGRTFLIEANTAGAQTTIVVRNGQLLGAEGGRAFDCLGAAKLHLEDVSSYTPGDTWNITCGDAALVNTTTSVLNASGIQVPTFINVRTGGGIQVNGRVDGFTGTITGTVTNPSSTVIVEQQGDEVTLLIPQLTAVSNTTGCTLDGLPAKYQPAVARSYPCIVQDNGVNSTQFINIGASASLTLTKNGSSTGFTGTGSKGIYVNSIKYKLYF